jgi:hypothetical protein
VRIKSLLSYVHRLLLCQVDPRRSLATLDAIAQRYYRQHLISRFPKPIHGLDPTGCIGVGLAQHREVFARAQRPLMRRGIGLAHLQDRQ